MSRIVTLAGVLGGIVFKICASGSGGSMAGRWENWGALLSKLVGGKVCFFFWFKGLWWVNTPSYPKITS